MKLLLFNIPSILCLAIAGYLAVHDKDGWGWFLFIGAGLAITSVKTTSSKSK